ncbi:Cathepsin_B [Hexamita inflata]|uniref:Cathepsin_B n=1 Tax=Hexamita inflata TaxID=28002 RepID=A0ABP1KQ05_9EUKA
MIILASVLQVDFVNQEMVELLKNIPDMTWTPGIPAIFAGKSEEEVFMMIGDTNINFQHDLEPDILEKEAAMETQELLEKAVLPDSFSWFDLKPECMLLRDVGLCYAHWAFSSLGVFGDNRCIKGRDPVRVTYSEQYRISCDYYAIDLKYDHCVTGNISFNPYFMYSEGLPTDTCIRYTGKYTRCPTVCDNGSPLVRTTVASGKIYNGFLNKPNATSKEDMMKQHIMNFGSLLGSYDVYSDFLYYVDGIYQHVSGNFQGKQPVIIVGWGEEDGVKYWNIRNNWGLAFGEDGYFRILRGVNHCNIEDQCTVYEV